MWLFFKMFNNVVFGYKGFYYENCLKKKKLVKLIGFEIMIVLFYCFLIKY